MIELLIVFWKGMLLHLWQASLFIGVLFLLERGLRKAPARVTHALWQIGLIRLFLPLPLIKAVASNRVIETITIPGIAVLETIADPAVLVAGSAPVKHSLPGSVIAVATILWAAVVLAFLVRMVLDLRRTSTGAARPLEARDSNTARICEACGIDLNRVFITGKRLMPGVAGFFRPRIIIPAELLRSLSDDELAAVLIHEENHRRRMDPLRFLFARLGLALFHFYPLIYPMLHRLNATAEYACDEVALNSGISPSTYARAFTKTLRIGLTQGGMHYAAAGGNGALLKKRFTRLFEPRRYEMSYSSRVIIALAVLVLVAGFLIPAPSAAESEDVMPLVLKSVSPEYPKECLKAGYGGKLMLLAVIDEKGAVKEAKVTTIEMYKEDKEETGKDTDEAGTELCKEFQKAALAAIYQWEFKPGTKDGKPAVMEIKVPIEFKLD